MYDIASRMAGFLACQVGLEQSKVDTVRFGLEIIMGEIIKWVILLIAATLIGVLPGALYAMVSMGLFRLFSGGAHCEDYWRCLTFGLIVFLGAGKMGNYVEPYISQPVMVKAVVAGCLVMMALVFIWAPGEVVYRRIKPEERIPFKVLSLVFLVAWSIVTVFFVAPYSVSVVVAGLMTMIVQSISFTPPGYRMINGFDIVLSRIIGERRCFTHAENV